MDARHQITILDQDRADHKLAGAQAGLAIILAMATLACSIKEGMEEVMVAEAEVCLLFRNIFLF